MKRSPLLLISLIALTVVGAAAFLVSRNLERMDTARSGSLATPAAPPAITLIRELAILENARWLFAVDDGSNILTLSVERDGALLMGFFDINQPLEPINWQTVASTQDTGGEQIADHWHIFAHDAHWLAVSTATARKSYLVKVDKNLQRVFIKPAADAETTPIGTPIPTNDMFLVDSTGGVDVGHFYPGYGHRVLRFDKDGGLTAKVDAGGSKYVHANGSSAVRTTTGFSVFAPENLAPGAQSGIKRIDFDQQWKPLGVTTLISGDSLSAAMPTSVLLDSMYNILTVRVRSGTGATPVPNQPLPDDSGALVRYILKPSGGIDSQEMLVSSTANRPHTLLYKNKYLITAWDEAGKTKLRIETIN